jgi:hypothetical protein
VKILMSFRCRDDNELLEHVKFGAEIIQRRTAYIHFRHGVLVASQKLQT